MVPARRAHVLRRGVRHGSVPGKKRGAELARHLPRDGRGARILLEGQSADHRASSRSSCSSCLLWGHFSARSRVRNGIEMPFFGASGDMLGKFTTAILLFMILAYVPQIGGNALVVSQQSFRTFFDWTSGFVNGFYPELVAERLVRQFCAKRFQDGAREQSELPEPEHRPAERRRIQQADRAVHAEFSAGARRGPSRRRRPRATRSITC